MYAIQPEVFVRPVTRDDWLGDLVRTLSGDPAALRAYLMAAQADREELRRLRPSYRQVYEALESCIGAQKAAWIAAGEVGP